MTTIYTQRADVHIRWLINRDMPAVMDIENDSFPFAWNREDFTKALRQRNCMGMVAEIGDQIAGFMLYELHLNRLEITNIGVHPDCRRRGVGSSLIAKLASKLTTQRRKFVRAATMEANLTAQLFFRACGFRAVAIVPEFYEGEGITAYVFELQHGGKR